MFTKRSILFIVIMLLMVALAACGGGGDSASSGGGTSGQAEEAVPVSMGDRDEGKEQYDMLCIACHGPGGEGIEEQGGQKDHHHPAGG